MDFFLIFSKVSVIFMLILVGFVLTRKNIITAEAQPALINLLLYAFLPSALLKTFYVPFDRVVFGHGIKIVLIMGVVYSLATLFTFFFAKLLTKDLKKQDVYTIGMVLPNVTFMGYPVIESLLGPEYLFYIVMANIPFEILAWTLMVWIFSRNTGVGSDVGFVKRLVTAPPLVGIVISIVVYLSQIPLPDPLVSTIHYLAGGMTPVAMIVVGMSLAKAKIRDLIINPGLYIASAIRLLVFPAALFFILMALGFSGPTLIIPTAIFAMPTAGYTSIMASKYGSDATFAAELISLCTLLSLLTIPMIMSLLQ